jgi:hypothetical protein
MYLGKLFMQAKNRPNYIVRSTNLKKSRLMILLSFDIEEFDMPFEYGKSLDFKEQLSVSTEGTLVILNLLKEANIKATFYCTANYANHKPDIIRKIVDEGHELASHGYFHSEFIPEHLASSKKY